MDQNQYQLSINHSDDEQAKHLRKSLDDNEKNLITCMENLSNDLLWEIFDYFDGYELYQSFWNLNTHFQNLLICSSYPLNFSSFYFLQENHLSHCCTEFIYPNRHRIVSLQFSYQRNTELFFRLITLDQSFYRLQSLCLSPMESADLIPLLKTLPSLPRLISLTLFISDWRLSKGMDKSYRLIFNLPVLKYIKFSSETRYSPISPPSNTNNQFSTIESMIINHTCDLDQLMILISYTPRLTRLVYTGPLNSRQNIERKISVTLPNLRYVSIHQSYLTFNEFELFIMNICSQIRVLRIIAMQDSAYLDANRWERLISKYMPYLKGFYFHYHEFFDDRSKITKHHQLIHQFTSSFWLERQWIFQLETKQDRHGDNAIFYSIGPHKREWYQLPENVENNVYFNQDSNLNQSQQVICCSEKKIDELPVETCTSTKLIVKCHEFQRIIPLFTIVRITKLEVFGYEIFIDLISHLPNLDTLSVSSFSLPQRDCLSLEETDIYLRTLNNNKITKVKLWGMNNLLEIQFLLDLCPFVKYFEIENRSKIDHKVLVRFILTQNIRNTPYLHTMGLCIKEKVDKTIEKLQNMINREKLTHEYTIKYINDTIYIQWK